MAVDAGCGKTGRDVCSSVVTGASRHMFPVDASASVWWLQIVWKLRPRVYRVRTCTHGLAQPLLNMAESAFVRAFTFASNGNLKELKALVGRDVAVDVVRPDGLFKGYTLLHAAASKGHVEVVEYLLSSGASLHVLNAQGKTACTLARDKNQSAVVARLEAAALTTAKSAEVAPTAVAVLADTIAVLDISESTLEAQFDEHVKRAVAQGRLSEAAADAMTDEIAARPDSAARCEAMRRIMSEHPEPSASAPNSYWKVPHTNEGELLRREEERRGHLEERERAEVLMQSAREEYTAEAEEQIHELRRTISSLQSDLQAAKKEAAAAAVLAAATLEAQNEANELRRQVSELEMDKLKLQKGFESAFKSNIRRYRDTILKITGYRIDMRHLEGSKDMHMFDVYLIDHVRKEPLHFRLSDADHAVPEILPSPLLEKLLAEHPSASLEDYLKEGNFAAFLSAATLELNKKAR